MIGRSWKAILVLMIVATLVALVAIRNQQPQVDVHVRQGEPSVDSGQNALVILKADLVEQLVRDAVVEADLPFEVSDIRTQFVSTGISVSGRAHAELFAVPFSAGFSAIAHPVVRSGTVGVRLSELKAVGSELPSIFQPAIERVINEQLTEATQLKDFEVKDVEVGNQELLVYLRYSPKAAENTPAAP